MPKPKVIAIVGPTASGKTRVSLSLAEKFNGEIISADSRQVYRGLDIGTEKITLDETAGIPHHLIDVVDPRETFTALDFKQQGERAISQIIERNNIPCVVGGTGFYIRALLDGLVLPEISANKKLREELESKSTAELYNLLRKKDPDRAATIEPENPRRLIRALEIVEALGKVPPLNFRQTVFDTLYIGLDVPDEVLKERLAKRLNTQIDRGLLNEVKRLLGKVPRERISEFGFEYRLAAEHLDGTLTLSEFKEKLQYELWHYAKRQRRWFKNDERILWFTPEQGTEIERVVTSFLKK